jgi:hypothetical protein
MLALRPRRAQLRAPHLALFLPVQLGLRDERQALGAARVQLRHGLRQVLGQVLVAGGERDSGQPTGRTQET